jgi:hypothetical protein
MKAVVFHGVGDLPITPTSWSDKEREIQTARKEQPMSTSIGDIAANVGKGLFAGVAGTAMMTVSSTLEMKLSGRGPSQTPAEAAKKVLKVEPEDEGAVLQPGPLRIWYGLGRRAGTFGLGRTLRPCGHGGAPRAGVGSRAGRPADPGRFGPCVQVRL